MRQAARRRLLTIKVESQARHPFFPRNSLIVVHVTDPREGLHATLRFHDLLDESAQVPVLRLVQEVVFVYVHHRKLPV